jgi:hypothetical protein
MLISIMLLMCIKLAFVLAEFVANGHIYVRSQISTAALLMLQVFWDMTLCCQVGVRNIFKRCSALSFKGLGVQEECQTEGMWQYRSVSKIVEV